MTSAAARVYRLFKRADGQAASVRTVVIAMIALACAVVAIGVVRVAREHEVLRLGYQLSQRAGHLRELEEVRRRLELEHATLTAPDRIRRLASELGMATVAPDRIRIVDGHHKVAAQP
ncbi:MAG: cell division protein FtsL [Acidobacteriota bacterium]